MADRCAAFISYAHRYAPWVRTLQANLEKCLAAAGRPGVVFLDQTDLGSGRSWVTQLQMGVDRSEHLVLIATPEALASPRVGDEWQTFVTNRRNWSAGRFHVAELVGVPIPPFPDQVQRVDFRRASEAKYRKSLQQLVAGLLGHPDNRSLPELPEDIDFPSPPDPGLDPQIRSRLIAWLTPVLEREVARLAVAAKFRRAPEELDGQPSAECLASALLVWETADAEPLSAAMRIVDTLRETFRQDLSARVAELLPLRADLVARQKDSPARALLEAWLERVSDDHKLRRPYFQREAEAVLLERVYVQLEVRPEERAALSEVVLDSKAFRAGRPLGLREMLALPREENPWISGHWVVLGDPGSGKTTLLRHLAADLAQELDRPWVPLFESLPKLMRGGGWLLDRVVRRMESAGHSAQDLATVLNRKATDGRLLLLLDGLDEVPSAEKEDAEKLLGDLVGRWPSTPIVVASRPIGYRPLGADFRELRILPLDRERKREFLARWLGRAAGGRDEARAEAAIDVLDGPDLRDLAGNPLYLTLMALLFEQGEEPARNRTKLYDQVFDLLLEGRHRLERRPIEAKSCVRSVLRHLADGMTRDGCWAEPVEGIEQRLYGEGLAKERKILEQVPCWHGRMREFLEDLGRTGIFAAHDGEDSDWRFWHRTFREALAAERLETEYRAKEGKGAVLARAQTITTEEDLSAWAEPFALLAGRLDAPDELVRDLVKENRALGLRAVATAQRLQPETLTEILGLSEKWEERTTVYARIPKLVGEPRRALALLNQLRQATTNGNDLFFLDRAAREVGRQFPDHAQEAGDLAEGLYGHLSKPDEDLFRWIDASKDGRVPLWRQIPAGETWIGSPESEGHGDEKPRHRVAIVRPFALAAVTVTNAQFRAFDPSHELHEWKGVSVEELPFHPVVNVTWYEAVSFCRWLASRFPWARRARLPLEEEWEHACRGEKETRHWSGDKEKDLSRVGWYGQNSGERTHRVGEKEKNPWGLYDVHGNVWEWTLSAYTTSYKGSLAVVDPLAVDLEAIAREASSGRRHVARGGSAWFLADRARAAFREFWDPDWST